MLQITRRNCWGWILQTMALWFNQMAIPFAFPAASILLLGAMLSGITGRNTKPRSILTLVTFAAKRSNCPVSGLITFGQSMGFQPNTWKTLLGSTFSQKEVTFSLCLYTLKSCLISVSGIGQEFNGSFTCLTCGKSYASRTHAHRHIKDKHMQTFECFECPICHKEFAAKRYRNDHVKRAHGSEKGATGQKIS